MAESKKMDTVVRFSPLDIPKILRAHWNAKPKEPLHFVAEPSTVKSEGVFQESKSIAEAEGRAFFDWNRSTLEQKQELLKDASKVFVFADLRASETDIGELRLQEMRNGDGYITFKYNILFAVLSKKDAMGVLFFDEMNLAPNMIKAQFYKVINDRAVGDIPISDNVLCVSAGNESEHSRGVTEDPVPLVLRRGNYFLRPLSAEEWSDYAVRSAHHEWVVGYVNFQPQDVHNVAYDLPDSVGQPCPRTWSKLSNVIKSNPKLSLDDVEMLAVGLVGQGVARKFAAYVKAAKKIDLNEVIRNPKLIREYEANPDSLSLVYAIIAGVTEKFRDDKKVLEPAMKMMLEFQRPEFGAYLIRSVKQVDPKGFMKVGTKQVDTDVLNKVYERYAKFLLDE